jgi:hypothetical protein
MKDTLPREKLDNAMEVTPEFLSRTVVRDMLKHLRSLAGPVGWGEYLMTLFAGEWTRRKWTRAADRGVLIIDLHAGRADRGPPISVALVQRYRFQSLIIRDRLGEQRAQKCRWHPGYRR